MLSYYTALQLLLQLRLSDLQILAPPNCFSSDRAPKKSVLFVCSDLYMGVNTKYLGYKGPSVFWG